MTFWSRQCDITCGAGALWGAPHDHLLGSIYRHWEPTERSQEALHSISLQFVVAFLAELHSDYPYTKVR